eukprot:5964159-Pleurochrysis_carterae.AAC.5
MDVRCKVHSHVRGIMTAAACTVCLRLNVCTGKRWQESDALCGLPNRVKTEGPRVQYGEGVKGSAQPYSTSSAPYRRLGNSKPYSGKTPQRLPGRSLVVLDGCCQCSRDPTDAAAPVAASSLLRHPPALIVVLYLPSAVSTYIVVGCEYVKCSGGENGEVGGEIGRAMKS